MKNKSQSELTRRSFFQSASMLGAASILGAGPLTPALHAEKKAGKKVRDHFWLWSHVASTYNAGGNPRKQFGLPGESHITPVEAAYYLGIPNVCMVDYKGVPAPQDLNQFVVPFLSLNQVVWSIVDPGPIHPEGEREAVLDLAFKTPNITGVVMDDFFYRVTWKGTDRVAFMSLDELKQLKQELRRGNKQLELWVVIYAHEINSDTFQNTVPYLELCDVITVWPWSFGTEIPEMGKTFEKLDKAVPGKRKALGNFMWNFGQRKPLPISMMEQQCELGLDWLRSGKIESMVFGLSWLVDRDLDTVDWTRKWIEKVGDQKL